MDVDPGLARDRIAKGHFQSGIEGVWGKAVKRAEGNDLLNGVEIRRKLCRPDVVVMSVQE